MHNCTWSPDQHWFIYSTWSPSIHICNVWSGEEDKHYSLNLRPNNEERFCAFAARFSGDGDEIIASWVTIIMYSIKMTPTYYYRASDGCLYVYDRQRCDRILKVRPVEQWIEKCVVLSNFLITPAFLPIIYWVFKCRSMLIKTMQMLWNLQIMTLILYILVAMMVCVRCVDSINISKVPAFTGLLQIP